MTLKVIHYDLGHKSNKTLYDIQVVQYDIGYSSYNTKYTCRRRHLSSTRQRNNT